MTATITVQDIYRRIRDVPDFPKAGILFKDITPLLLDASAFRRTVELMAGPFRGAEVTRVVSIESRGFLLGAPIALALDAGLVPIRKPGKLPSERGRVEYALEYGTDALEMHSDAVGARDRVLVVDDVLTTGQATIDAITQARAAGLDVRHALVLVDRQEDGGRQRVEALGVSLTSLLTLQDLKDLKGKPDA